MMTSDELLRLMDQALRGEARLDDLFAALDAARLQSPATVAEFMRAVDAMYARNEIRYDAYLILKDRVAMSTRSPATKPPVATQPPPAPPAGTTVLRPSVASAAAETPADRTMLRYPTHPQRTAPPVRETGPAPAIRPPGPVTGSGIATATAPRVPTSPTGAGAAGASLDAGGWTLTTEQPLEPGSLIKDRFLLEERLGAGGMGVVFKARDRVREEAQDRDPYVAIKFLNPEFRRHPDAFKVLQRETKRTQALAHPNVVTVYDCDRDGTLIFMHMEYLAGEPLDRFIQRHPQGLKFSEAWPIIEGAGRALMYAHEQGNIHADFKPGNVFVGEKKTKVLDFGIARALQSNLGRDDGTRLNMGSLGALTPAYASPEMLLNEVPDPRDDIYALACVSYELMTGRHPFGGVPAVKAAHDGLKVKRIPGMGRYQYKALMHGLAFRRADRTPSVEDFLDEIAGPFGVKGRALRRVVLSTAGTALVVGIAAAALLWYTRPDPDEELARRLQESAAAQIEESIRNGEAAGELDPEALKTQLELGDAYLAMGREKFDARVLSEGVSNAHDAFREMLRMDPKNKQAVDGIVAIVGLYEAEIRRRLDAGDYAGVVELTGYARKIDPNRASFEDAEREAKARLAKAAASVEEK